MEIYYKQGIIKSLENLSGKGKRDFSIQGQVGRMAAFWQEIEVNCEPRVTFVFYKSNAQDGPDQEKAAQLLATTVIFLS